MSHVVREGLAANAAKRMFLLIYRHQIDMY